MKRLALLLPLFALAAAPARAAETAKGLLAFRQSEKKQTPKPFPSWYALVPARPLPP